MTASGELEVLFLPRYQPLGSSSRLRCYQYLPGLETCGIRGRVVPLLSDEYVKSLYTGEARPYAGILAGYARRVREFVRARPVDLVWIERELLPWLPEWVERANLVAEELGSHFHVHFHGVQAFVARQDDLIMGQRAFHGEQRGFDLRGENVHAADDEHVVAAARDAAHAAHGAPARAGPLRQHTDVARAVAD